MERRADMYVSTLHDMIRAMGGTLEIRAIFPEGDVRINQFQNLGDTHNQIELRVCEIITDTS
jgi:hypothetical protein